VTVQNSRAMVAGGAGFVGSALVRQLLDLNCEVIVYDNFLHGSPDHVRNLGARISVVVGDAKDRAHLSDVLRRKRVQFVFNCVGDTFVPDAYDHAERFFDNNTAAAVSIMLASRDAMVERVLYVSSTEVYGDVGIDRPIDESLPCSPVNTYAVSKLAADRLCRTFHIEHGLPIVLARIFNCYGPRETHPYIVPELIRQLHCGPRLRLGNVAAYRDFTYVEDTARALIQLVEHGPADATPVNVGSGHGITIGSLALRVGHMYGYDHVDIELDTGRLRRRDIDCFICDPTRLRELTGWSPQVDLDTGLRRTVEWFERNGHMWSFEQPGVTVGG
jgi:nucleoside-diphosphate-sugar epimerase